MTCHSLPPFSPSRFTQISALLSSWFSFIYHFQTSKSSPALYIPQYNPAYHMMNTDDETDSSLACLFSFIYSPVPVLLGSVLESGSLYPRVIRGSSSMNGERSV